VHVLLNRLHQARDIRVLVKTGNMPVRIETKRFEVKFSGPAHDGTTVVLL
jgi:hypothetical protein